MNRCIFYFPNGKVIEMYLNRVPNLGELITVDPKDLGIEEPSEYAFKVTEIEHALGLSRNLISPYETLGLIAIRIHLSK